MELSLTGYSANKLLRTSGKAKISGKLVNDSIKAGTPMDLISRSYFPITFPNGSVLQEGQAITPEELKQAGVKSFILRFNQDRDIATIKV
jgi:hypothetical protein